MALAQFGTQDQDQDQIKGERREEERYKCCFDIRVMVWTSGGWKKQIHGTPGRGRRWAVAAWLVSGETRGGPLLAAAGELLLKQPPELSHPVCFVSNALHNHFRAFSNNSTGKYGKCRVVECWIWNRQCRWHPPGNFFSTPIQDIGVNLTYQVQPFLFIRNKKKSDQLHLSVGETCEWHHRQYRWLRYTSLFQLNCSFMLQHLKIVWIKTTRQSHPNLLF